MQLTQYYKIKICYIFLFILKLFGIKCSLQRTKHNYTERHNSYVEEALYYYFTTIYISVSIIYLVNNSRYYVLQTVNEELSLN